MRDCVCGTAIDDDRALCAQCGALQELGLAAGASLDEVKAAYKMLVKVWHPDRFQSDREVGQAAEAKLKAINIAYSYLASNGYESDRGYEGGTKQGSGARKGSNTNRGPVYGASGKRTGASAPRAARRPAQKQPRRQTRRQTSPDRRIWGIWGANVGLRLAFRLLVLVVVLVTGWFLFGIADSYIAADPTMGKYYLETKSQLKSDFESARQRTWGSLEQRLHGLFGGSSGTVPAAAAPVGDTAATTPEQGTVDPVNGEKHSGVKAPATPLRLLPYVTLGLTRDEVIAAQGEPTSSTTGKLMYNASELDLKDGKVVGWKIDPRSPLRVKLWPEGPVDSSLRFFTVGSTKDEVLVVEGTPTSFSQDRFDYGSSVVYFRDGRVVAWKDGPGAVPLRTER
jgi:curved DNA-binding protein CbpA